MKLIFYFYLLIFISSFINAQYVNNKTNSLVDIQNQERNYLTDNSGNLRMYINVWGSGGTSTGRLVVSEGVNLVTILSMVGGPKVGYNYKKVIILREYPDENNNQKLIVDMTEFLKTGNRSKLIKILPNDTIIINQKFRYLLVERITEITTLISIFSIIMNFII